MRLPKTIVIQLVRFDNDGKKREDFVDFDLDGLNLGEYTEEGQLNSYKLLDKEGLDKFLAPEDDVTYKCRQTGVRANRTAN